MDRRGDVVGALYRADWGSVGGRGGVGAANGRRGDRAPALETVSNASSRQP